METNKNAIFLKIAFTHTGRSVGWVGWFCFRLKSVNQLGWLWTTSFDLSGILVGRQHLPRIWFSHDDIRIARERSQQNKHIWDFCWSHMCQCPSIKSSPIAKPIVNKNIPSRPCGQTRYGYIILLQGREEEGQVIPLTEKQRTRNIHGNLQQEELSWGFTH